MKILITGGLGNLGSWLTRHFCETNHEIFVLAKNKREILDNQKFTYISCDISNLKDCQEKLNHIPFDYIIHTASVNDMFVENYAALALEINTKGTRNILEAIDKSSVKNFIYFSTFHVYGVSSGNINEDSPLNSRHDYATTHLFAEYYVKQFHLAHNLPYTIIRLTNSYGCPIDLQTSKWYLILNDLAKMAFEKSEIILKGNGLASRDFIWMGTVCNVVEALTKLEQAPNDIYNLSGEQTFQMIQIAEYVQKAYFEYSGNKIDIEINKEDKTQVGAPLNVSSSKLKALLHYENPIMFETEASNIFKLLSTNQLTNA